MRHSLRDLAASGCVEAFGGDVPGAAWRGTEAMVAVIGWGSLIWDPRDLELASEWLTDGPMLPMEFARFSSRDRLTLVLTEGVPEQSTLWAISASDPFEEASTDLEARERCGPKGIGSWPRLAGGSSIRTYDAALEAWVGGKRLDGAVWTALGTTDASKKRGLLSEDARLEYPRALERDGRAAAAREYIERAPAQIRTPFRELVKRELGWGRQPDLVSAI